jgi:hypothetical protein
LGDAGTAAKMRGMKLGLIRLRMGLRRDKLGLIGFVLLLGGGHFVFISFCTIDA